MRCRRRFAVVALATTLMGCGGQTHRLQGAFILNDPAVDHGDSTCSGTGEYADIKEGLGVVVKDEAGQTVGSAELVFHPRGSASQCVYTWEMVVVDAASYSIQVGERAAGTYSADEMRSRYWQVAATVGE